MRKRKAAYEVCECIASLKVGVLSASRLRAYCFDQDHHRRVSTHREALMHSEEKDSGVSSGWDRAAQLCLQDACFCHLVAPLTWKILS